MIRRLQIFIPDDLSEKELKLHLYNRVSEDPREESRVLIAELRRIKREIISEAEANPTELKVWLYEKSRRSTF